MEGRGPKCSPPPSCRTSAQTVHLPRPRAMFLLHPGNPLVGGFWGDIQYVNMRGGVLVSSCSSARWESSTSSRRCFHYSFQRHTAVRNLAEFDLAGGSTFSTRGRLENFHTQKKVKKKNGHSPKRKARKRQQRR